METAALCKPIQRFADLLRIPGTWVLTGLGKLLAALGSFPHFPQPLRLLHTHLYWRFLECQSIEVTLTQNGHLTHHEIPSVASLRPGGHFPRIGWPVSPEYAFVGYLVIHGVVGGLSQAVPGRSTLDSRSAAVGWSFSGGQPACIINPVRDRFTTAQPKAWPDPWTPWTGSLRSSLTFLTPARRWCAITAGIRMPLAGSDDWGDKLQRPGHPHMNQRPKPVAFPEPDVRTGPGCCARSTKLTPSLVLVAWRR